MNKKELREPVQLELPFTWRDSVSECATVKESNKESVEKKQGWVFPSPVWQYPPSWG